MKRIVLALSLLISGCALPVEIKKQELSPDALELAIQQQAAIQTDIMRALNNLIADLKAKGILIDKPANEKAPPKS